MKKQLFVFCLSFVSLHIIAQENTLAKKVHGAYLGESFLQSGLRTGYSHEFWKKTKVKKSSRNFPEGRQKTHSFAGLHQIGFYSRKKLYTSVPITSSLLYRRIRTTGFMTQYAFGMGYDRTFLKGGTYEVDNSGNVSKEKLAGSGYIVSQVMIGWGIDFSKFSTPYPMSVVCKNTILMKHGYNNTVIPFWLTEIEFTYTLKK